MKIAVITGASSGMGREFVYAIDKSYELDEIWVIARREDRLNDLKKECNQSPFLATLFTERAYAFQMSIKRRCYNEKRTD